MDLTYYDFILKTIDHDYEFYSKGAKGTIRKGARFTLMKSQYSLFYNLAFGDWDENSESINDNLISNNGDAEKVLSTIAMIIVDFTQFIPDALIYVEGNTASRTRKYQIGINKFLNKIEPLFNIYGVKQDESWEPFRKNVNYIAFAANRIVTNNIKL
jgi:hypothetical protein